MTFRKKVNLILRKLFDKKQSAFYLLFIIIPLSFYDVFIDYQFPIDILSFGLTTSVISFVSMSSWLVSAYSSEFMFSKLKVKFGIEKMSYIYLIGCASLMLLYCFMPSIVMIIAMSLFMGVLDSFGTVCYRKRFIEISKDEKIEEDDANVIVKLGEKIGDTVGPSLIGIFSGSFILPVTMFGSFGLYRIMRRIFRKK